MLDFHFFTEEFYVDELCCETGM